MSIKEIPQLSIFSVFSLCGIFIGFIDIKQLDAYFILLNAIRQDKKKITL